MACIFNAPVIFSGFQETGQFQATFHIIQYLVSTAWLQKYISRGDSVYLNATPANLILEET